MVNFRSSNENRGPRGNRPEGRSGGFNGRNSGGPRGNRPEGRSGGFNGGNFGGRDRDNSRGRDFGNRGNRPIEKHNVTCDKCGKDCQVPFKPSGSRPVLCSDCFKKDGGNKPSASGISQEQYKELNMKLDKIVQMLKE